jgi:hypothetical protein
LNAGDERDHAVVGNSEDLAWNRLCRIGGIAAFVMIVYCLATMVQLIVLGGQPTTAAEAFRLLQENKLVGLLRLDLPTVVVLPLYYLVFLGLFAALRRTDLANAIISTLLAFVGVTLIVATPTALPMVGLGEKYANATTEAARAQLLAAGETVLATDIWHATGAFMGGILLQTGAVLISLVMLRSSAFGKVVAYLGIVAHGLDLGHIILGHLVPTIGVVLMAIAGPLYPVWFFLVGRRLLTQHPPASLANGVN